MPLLYALCRLLHEMFPEVSANEIHDAFVAMEMDVDRTVEYLLNDKRQQMRQQPEESGCLETVGSVSACVHACVHACVCYLCAHLYVFL